MKRSLQILLCFFTISLTNTITPTTQDPTKLFMGAVQFSNIMESDLCLYYKGQKIKTENTNDPQVQFSFLESKYAQDMYILICESVSYQTENNTIQNLCVTDSSYKCYKLQATRISDENNATSGFSWNSQEHQLADGVVPDNTLIFVFNPDYIQGLVTHSWKADNTLRIVPSIIINQELSTEQLKRAMTIARLAAIDIDTVHKKISNQSVQSQGAQALLTFIQ